MLPIVAWLIQCHRIRPWTITCYCYQNYAALSTAALLFHFLLFHMFVVSLSHERETTNEKNAYTMFAQRDPELRFHVLNFTGSDCSESKSLKMKKTKQNTLMLCGKYAPVRNQWCCVISVRSPRVTDTFVSTSGSGIRWKQKHLFFMSNNS